jgi:replicative DNA helicase
MTHDDDTLTLPTVPWSCEAEQSLLGGLLLEADALHRVPALQTEELYDPRHRTILGAIQSLTLARHPVDAVSVFEVLSESGAAENCGGLGYLNALAQSVPSARNVAHYAGIVREKASQRAVLEAAGETMAIARGRGDVAGKLHQIAQLFTTLQRQAVRKVPRKLAEVAAGRLQHYSDVAEGRIEAGWRTHIPGLDRLLAGGLKPGKLVILAARPSVGKSSFSQQVATSLARDGRTALLLSQEMEESELYDRALAATAQIDLGELETGDRAVDWGCVTEATDTLGGLPLYVDDQSALTLADIRMKARSVPGLKLLVVDYIQLCAPSKAMQKENRSVQVGEISRGLKALAKDLGICVIALSQLNRGVESRPDKRPNLGDLRDSGEIEADADIVAFLWPVRDLGNDQKLVGCGLDKNRGGRVGQIALHFDGPRQRWHESAMSLEQASKTERKGGFE